MDRIRSWRLRALLMGIAVAVGTFVGSMATAAPPSNDNFGSALVLSAAAGSLTASTAEATKQPDEPDHAGDPGGASVWYSWTPSFTGTASIDTVGSDLDTLLAAYSGTSVSSLRLVASNDDAGGTDSSSRVCFQVVAGVTWKIAVDGFRGGTGNIALHWGEKADSAPCPTLPPMLSSPVGTPSVGYELGFTSGVFADPGAWSASQWVRCAGDLCGPIPGAVGPSYVLTPRDVGTAILVDVTNSQGASSARNQSNMSAVVTASAATGSNGRIYWYDSDIGGTRSMFSDKTGALTVDVPGIATPSPDGTLLAWVFDSRIFISTADNSARVDTGIKGLTLSWSPDGSRVAFISSEPPTTGSLMTLDLFTGDVATIRSFPVNTGILDYEWSPDGSKFAVSYVDFSTATGNDIAIIAADGRGPITRLTATPEWDRSPSWSPTGDRIVFTRGFGAGSGQDADLWMMDADGSNPTQLVDGDLQHPVDRAAWSPDGTTIVYGWTRFSSGSRHGDLYTIPTAGGSATRLTDAGDLQGAYQPTWARRASYTLHVERIGNGVVTSTPAAIACGGTCDAVLNDPTTLTLSASPEPGWHLVGWGGDCAGLDRCVVLMTGDRDVVAVFETIQTSGGSSSGEGVSSGGSNLPDLELSLTSDRSRAVVGEQALLRASVRVKNYTATSGAGDLRLTVVLPPSLELVSTSQNRGSGCAGTGTVSCDLDFLSGTLVANVDLLVKVKSTSESVVSASVRASETDPDTSNNAATVRLNAPVLTPPVASVPKAPTAARGLTVTGTAKGETLRGTVFGDRLDGRGGPDRIFGYAGNDILTGGAGADSIDAGAGNDLVRARDGKRDRVRCGPGTDTVYADHLDLLIGCEKSQRR